jgi:hypothetical protein
MAELEEMVSTNFTSASDAYMFFAKHGPTRSAFDCDCFSKAVNSLIPSRFNDKEIKQIWAFITGGAPAMNKPSFVNYFRNI